jgi:tRNA (mo5U34)-methyltransferase
MDPESELREKRRVNPVKQGLEQTGLYHSFRLPDGRLAVGAMSLDWQEKRLAAFDLPPNLEGKRVLDIGPWDGYYTFEMERRGAEVTAIDYVDLDTFRALHRAFASKAVYRRMDVYEIDASGLGPFDIVLCLGVLYHLKHPLLALEKICAVTRDRCVVDTFVVDGEEHQHGLGSPLPFAEFYERAEMGGQTDNWCGPTVAAVEAWIRAAGFARAEVRLVTDTTACVVGHRKWGALPPCDAPPIVLRLVKCHANPGKSFQSCKEEYIELFCEWPAGAVPDLGSVYPEVDSFGVAPLDCCLTPYGLLATFRVPPGLPPGSHTSRLKIGNAGWSNELTFYMDLPPVDVTPEIRSAQDGITWQSGIVNWADGGWLTLWVYGLSAEADPGNTTVLISGVPHVPGVVVPSANGQVNVQLRPIIGPGVHDVVVVHRGSRSSPVTIQVQGHPPAIRGLESLSEL